MAYEWRENPACVATYNILEGEPFLDQFEDASVPFKDAGALKVGDLRYFPKTTANSNILTVLGHEVSRRFFTLLLKTYTVKKEDPATTTPEVLQALAGIFSDKTKTLADLAEAVDGHVKFPMEGG